MESNADSPLLTSIDVEDIPPIKGLNDFFVQFGVESKKLWYLAGHAIFTTVCQYSLGAVTQTFAGHVGTLDLAAVSVENSVIAGFSSGIMVGMGSALETLCGQAFGAGQVDMLGIYMQRSWVILFVTALLLLFLYIFATPLLLLIGQTEDISHAAVAYLFQLAVDVEARMGTMGRSSGAQPVMVVHGDCSNGIYSQWDLWSSMVWV